jgi:hypothetical protein
MVGGAGSGGGNTFTAAPVITFSDGFEDNTLSPFTTDKSGIVIGDGLWKVTSADKNSGTYSAVAGQAGRDDGGGDYSSGVSNLYLSNINVGPGGATISFSVKVNNWRASLTFTDGRQIVVFKGDDCNPSSCPWQSGWYRVTYSLSQGSYNFKWAYAAKNGLANRAFIDDIEIKENGTAINVTGNIELNGHLINNSPRDCYWGEQEISGEDQTMACKPGYFINGFRYSTENAGPTGDWSIIKLYCCRP